MREIPSHWAVINGRRIFSQRKDRAHPGDQELTASQKYGVIPKLMFVQLEGRKVVEVIQDATILKHVEQGDFVISMRSFQGGIEFSNYTGCVSSAYVALHPIKPIWPKYYEYLFKSADYVQALQSTSNLVRDGQALRFENFTLVQLPQFSIAEQQQIADYLDAQTAKIDALIGKQEQLIETLAERRQAVVSHAVTKGLDPNAPKKDSGIPSVGEIPKTWVTGPVKAFTESLDRIRIPLSSEERGSRQGDFPYYGASGVIDHVDDFLFDEDLILVSEDGANLVNRATPIAFVATGKYWVNNHAHILRPRDGNMSYWARRIETESLVPYVTGSAQPKLTIEALMNIRIAAPLASAEREQIAIYLDHETSKMDALSAKAREMIDVLKERRQALISAAVTGKIDVRGLT